MKRSSSESLGLKRKTTSLTDESEGFYGRDADKKAIIDMLISDDDDGSNPGVIPIVGMGGVGKTTLAQHVYNDKAVEEQFKVRAWVCVSDQFDETRVTKEIVEKVTGEAPRYNDLDQLQVVLKKALNEEKFLLVLDDVWSENYEEWKRLQIPLRSGARGSKLIITTRSDQVASKVQTVPTHYLKVLEYEDCWKLFARHACLDVNSTANRKLLKIGKEIVRKCAGLPLAAKALGGVLRWQRNAEKWVEVLESEIWDIQNAKILPSLALSYIHLPSHLKRCFAYCAAFPPGYKFQKEKLVALWMSERLVVQKGNKSLEEIGDMYFDDLASRSFFQHSSNFRGVPYFVMHGLMHELARFVSGEFCSRLDSGPSRKIGKRTRYLSYKPTKKDVPNEFHGIHEIPFLRSFIVAVADPLNASINMEIIARVIDGSLRTRNSLRVLSLPCNLRKIPNSIGNLKHLRHLDLSGASIRLLPEAVTTLFNLEILILRGCSRLVELPGDMARLINLCQLDLRGTKNLQRMPPGMGELKKLSKLTNFVIGENEGCSIKEVGNLHNLRGEIAIMGLENVKDDQDALEANLKETKNLKVLKLSWEGGADDSRQAKQVLERLQPHVRIESIWIRGYKGAEFPNWVGDISFSKLEKLNLNEIKKCIRLPPLGQLTSLEELSVDGGGNEVLEAIGLEFYGMCKRGEKPFSSLKTLSFYRMWKWREWSSWDGAFPLLEKLSLNDCRNLLSVPTHLPSLKRLSIWKCVELDFENISSCSTLETIYITESDKVKCISVETFPNLKELHILHCSNLESLVGSTAATTTTRTTDPLFSPSLTKLYILGFSKLVSFPGGGLRAPNLKSMIIRACRNLKSLPQGMHSLLPSLEELGIFYCPKIELFPEGGLPSKLQSLEIRGCKKLVGRRMQWGLQSLPSLSNIIIRGGSYEYGESSFPEEISWKLVRGCEKPAGSRMQWGLQSLPSPSNIIIRGGPYEDGESSFPEETLLPSSLKSLRIEGFSKMKSLNYKGLQHLTSLQSMGIVSCENLESLPEEGLPSSLSDLRIWHCPLLQKRLKREIGEDWPKIKHIRRLSIG